MKQAFVILIGIVATLLLSSGNSYGQKRDSVKIIGSGHEVFPKTQGELFAESKPKQDTIKVLMLVCDTAMKNDFGKRLTVNQELFRLERRWSEGVWWQYGYEVRGYQIGSSMLYLDGQGRVYDWNATYLDANKKPLPKSIVVWMTKEIK